MRSLLVASALLLAALAVPAPASALCVIEPPSFSACADVLPAGPCYVLVSSTNPVEDVPATGPCFVETTNAAGQSCREVGVNNVASLAVVCHGGDYGCANGEVAGEPTPQACAYSEPDGSTGFRCLRVIVQGSGPYTVTCLLPG